MRSCRLALVILLRYLVQPRDIYAAYNNITAGHEYELSPEGHFFPCFTIYRHLSSRSLLLNFTNGHCFSFTQIFHEWVCVSQVESCTIFCLLSICSDICITFSANYLAAKCSSRDRRTSLFIVSSCIIYVCVRRRMIRGISRKA